MNGRVYSEVNFILENLGEEYISKIPQKLLDIIKTKKIKSYEPKIDINKSLCKQNVERDTIVLLTMIYYNYWCENDEEKKELLQILMENGSGIKIWAKK